MSLLKPAARLRPAVTAAALIETLADTLRLGGNLDRDLNDGWDRLSAPGFQSLLAYEEAEVWLFRRLTELSALDALPPETRHRLQAKHAEIDALARRIDAEAVAAVKLLSNAGIPVILIKGIARRVLARRYPYLDARHTADVDLLLPSERLREAHALLQAGGYCAAYPGTESCEPHHHLPALWAERRVAVELHDSISLRVPPAVAWARANAGSEELEWGGVAVRVPGPTEMLWNAVIHALSDVIIYGFRLKHFLEVTALVAGGAPVDWSSIKARCSAAEPYDPETGAIYPPALTLAWLDCALHLVSPGLRPEPLERPAFDLKRLLRWRLLILRSTRWLNPSLTERLLEEGARALLGLPLRASPATASWPRRIRRQTAGQASRVLFQAWQLALAG